MRAIHAKVFDFWRGYWHEADVPDSFRETLRFRFRIHVLFGYSLSIPSLDHSLAYEACDQGMSSMIVRNLRRVIQVINSALPAHIYPDTFRST